MLDDDIEFYKVSPRKPGNYLSILLPSFPIFVVYIYVFIVGGDYKLIGLSLFLLVLLYVFSVCITLMGRSIIERTMNADSVPEEKRKSVRSIIEDIHIVSGLGEPRSRYLDQSFVNAYALRWRSADVIYFTRGLLEELSRDELRAVVAHEMARMDYEYDFIEYAKLTFKAIPRLLVSSLGGFLGMVVLIPIAVSILAILLFLIPYLILVATEDPAGMGIYYFMLFAAVVAFIQVQYSDRKTSYIKFYIADKKAIKWTMYPEAMIGAIKKASQSDPSKAWRWLNSAAFAIKGPGVKITSYFTTNPKRKRGSKSVEDEPTIHPISVMLPAFPNDEMRIEEIKRSIFSGIP